LKKNIALNTSLGGHVASKINLNFTKMKLHYLTNLWFYLSARYDCRGWFFVYLQYIFIHIKIPFLLLISVYSSQWRICKIRCVLYFVLS